MTQEKTHWKKAFKSDYLSSSDVDSKGLNLIIEKVLYKECMTQSGKVYCNVAFFKDGKTKPMILNVTNSKMVKKFANNKTHLEDWVNIPISVYVDSNVRFGKETTEGLRIRPVQPKFSKPELKPDTQQWKSAVDFLKGSGSISQIKAKYNLSQENEKKIQDEITV